MESALRNEEAKDLDGWGENVREGVTLSRGSEVIRNSLLISQYSRVKLEVREALEVFEMENLAERINDRLFHDAHG
jgi:hypothetical protein